MAWIRRESEGELGDACGAQVSSAQMSLELCAGEADIVQLFFYLSVEQTSSLFARFVKALGTLLCLRTGFQDRASIRL